MTAAVDWFDRNFAWSKPMGKALMFLSVVGTTGWGITKVATYIAAQEFLRVAAANQMRKEIEDQIKTQDIQQQQRLIATTEAVNSQLKDMAAIQQTMLKVLLEEHRR
jgi:hypothetical protein